MNNWIYFSWVLHRRFNCISRHACPPALGWMMKRPIPYQPFSVRFVPYFPTGSLGYIGIWFWVSLIPIPRIWYIVVEQKVALILYQRWLVEQKACCCVHFWALAIANPPKNRRFDLLRGCRGHRALSQALMRRRRLAGACWGQGGLRHGPSELQQISSVQYPCWLMNYSGLYFPKKWGLS